MKTAMKARTCALVFLGCASVPAFAQDSVPQCAVTNFDQSRNVFTVINEPYPGFVNQQCFLTVVPRQPIPLGTPGSGLPLLREYPAPLMVEGNYVITLSGGGGGGGSTEEGGGGGGAGAAPSQTTQYLSPGIYRLTIGTGGQGGVACITTQNGGRATDGNPTSISEAYSGQTIAGFPRAEYWAGSPYQPYLVASVGNTPSQSQPGFDGGGGVPVGAQSRGGTGGHTDPGFPLKGEDGGTLVEIGYPGRPGVGGDNLYRGRSRVFAGGGGGAGYGNGGNGQTMGANVNLAATPGELGAGGGGGGGGQNVCGDGARGGHGFISFRPA